MADLKENKKRLTINLSFFAANDHNNNCATKSSSTTKSPKNFEEPNGVVGLGIVAAMNELDPTHDPFSSAKSGRAAILAVSPRSNPIPILSNSISSVSAQHGGAAAKFGGGGGPNLAEEEEEEMELSEEYTCVISHIGNNLIKKREYFDGDLGNGSESYWKSSGVFSASSPPGGKAAATATVFWPAGFLSSCYLCNKQLHGLDIFMYRGEKAFCSAECRYKQISIDEHKEKCGSEVTKPLEYSVSPCSGPMQFFAGVAAA